MRLFKKLDSKRKGMILYVIVVLLTLMLVVGMCFVLMAEAEATASRIYREAANYRDEYPTPQELLGWTLGSVIYDAPDDINPQTRQASIDPFAGTGSRNAIRGHSLARTMYGWNYTTNPDGSLNGVGNNVPFNGSGNLHLTGANATNAFRGAPWTMDDYDILNNTQVSTDGFEMVPERMRVNNAGPFQFTGGANAPYTYPDRNNLYLGAVDTSGNIIARSFWRNDPRAVAVVAPATMNGGNQATWGFPDLNPNNLAWYQPGNPNGALQAASRRLKYLTMRPRPGDQLFPNEQTLSAAQVQGLVQQNVVFPGQSNWDINGDVTNLPNGTVNDSIWVDLGYPAVQLKFSNRWIKPLFAILIVDLDNRINLNVSGNTKEDTTLNWHGSTQGFGRWEINPSQLVGAGLTAAQKSDYLNLFRGDPTGAGAFSGRFGFSTTPNTLPDQAPGANQTLSGFPVPDRQGLLASPAGSGPKSYARVDWDGSRYTLQPGGPTQPIYAPPYMQATTVRMAMPNGLNSPFPNYDPTVAGQTSRYGDGINGYSSTGVQDARTFERQFHPSLFNPFQLNYGMPVVAGASDQNLPIGDLRIIMRPDPNYGFTTVGTGQVPNELSNSRIGQMWPTLMFANQNLFQRITPFSMDLDVAGAAPGQFDQAGGATTLQATYFNTTTGTWVPYNAAANPAPKPPFIPQSQGQPITFGQLLPARNALPAGTSDLRPNDWRSNLPDLGRVNLNRPLTDYPTPVQAGFRFTAAQTAQLNQAQKDRVLLANDIFARFVAATNAVTPQQLLAGNIAAGDPRFEATRYLAQLAANIVDYVDTDDYSTAFNWLSTAQQIQSLTTPYPNVQVNPNGWVFGTELPRIVINEVYAQIMNAPTDTFPKQNGVPGPAPAATYQAGGRSDPNTGPNNDTLPFSSLPGYPNGQNYTTRHATLPYHVNFFVELHNPHNVDVNLSENGAARLQLADNTVPNLQRGVYQIQIQSQVDKNALRAPGNVTGNLTPTAGAAQLINITCGHFDPDPNPGVPAAPNPAGTTQDPAVVAPDDYHYTVRPSNKQYAPWTLNPPPANRSGSRVGYYLLGPSETTNMWQSDFPYDHTVAGATRPFRPTLTVRDQNIPAFNNFPAYRNQLSTQVPLTTQTTGIAASLPYTVALRRLANPNTTPANDPTQSNYNPFVTVDYIDGASIFDSILYDQNQPHDGQNGRPLRHRMTALDPNKPVPNPPVPRSSFGRRQPFRATPIMSAVQNTDIVNQPLNTFTRENGTSYLIATQTGSATNGVNPSTLDSPFDWLTHMDRAIASPMDILNVSGFKPHELTQQFVTLVSSSGAAPQPSYATPTTSVYPPATFTVVKQQHLVPWFDLQQSSISGQVSPMQTRLSRCLEMLSAGDYTTGCAFGGRVMGKVNVNTIWSTNLTAGNVAGGDNKVIMRALADPMSPANAAKSGNFFTQADVDNYFSNLILRRTVAGTAVANGGTGIPAPDVVTAAGNQKDRPYWSLAVPSLAVPNGATFATVLDSQYPLPSSTAPNYDTYGLNVPPNGRGLNRTLLADLTGGGTSTQRMVDVSNAVQQGHPYLQHEMLQKIAGHVTTRSNTFAIYVTTGFFYVRTPPNSTLTGFNPNDPPKLGAEVDQGLRHKMFAVIDRTNLTQDINETSNIRPTAVNNPRLQGPRPIFFAYNPVTVQGNNVTGLSQTDPGPAVVTLQVPAYGLGPNGGPVVRDTVDHNGLDFSATSGEFFEILAGSKLFLGTGDPTNASSDAETVTVTSVSAGPPVNGNPTYLLQFQTVAGSKRHYSGSRVSTQQLGNPGPQPLPIDYESPPYSNTVVPFRTIIQ